MHELVGPDGLSFGSGLVAAVIVKHTNPCGVAVAEDLATAYRRALAGDPVSAFGGIVALSGRVDEALAEQIVESPLADVLDRARLRRGCPRPLRRQAEEHAGDRGAFPVACRGSAFARSTVASSSRSLTGSDRHPRRGGWRRSSRRADEQWRDLELAWRVCARTSSNAVVLAYGGQVVGVGCGQQNRVDAAGIAARKAAGRAQGARGRVTHSFRFEMGWTR